MLFLGELQLMMKLAETQNFLELYMHAAGKSEVPPDWHWWAAMSLVAASLQKRVVAVEQSGRVMDSSLFIVLLGGSGEGKSETVRELWRYVNATDNPDAYRIITPFSGRATMQYLFDFLKAKYKPVLENGVPIINEPAAWVIQDELLFGVGDKRRAADYISSMMSFYTAQEEVAEGTRTNSGVIFRRPVFNWLVGTTRESYTELMGKDSLINGFGARVIFVFSGKDYEGDRVRTPRYPADRDMVMTYLRARVQEMCMLKAAVPLTEEAEAVAEKWYQDRDERPTPTDDSEKAFWNRTYALALKFALIFSVARHDYPLVVSGKDMLYGIQLMKKLWNETLPQIKATVFTTTTVREIDVIAGIIKEWTNKQGAIMHSDLVQKAKGKGLTLDKHVQPAIRQLFEEERIVPGRTPATGRRRGLTYSWVEKEEEAKT